MSVATTPNDIELSVDLDLICRVLHDMALKHFNHFDESRLQEDLDKSILYGCIAHGLIPENDQRRFAILNNLGTSFNIRYKNYRITEDLEEAIKHNRTALQLCPTGHLCRADALNNLANALATRFEHHGQIADLNDAIEHHREAVQLRPIDSPHRIPSLNNLARSLATRFGEETQISDLNEAVEFYRASLQFCPDDHPNHLGSLNGLASSLRLRFEECGQTMDLDESIDHYRAALQLHPNSHPNRCFSLVGLALSLRTRFNQYGQIADLDEAIEQYRETLEPSPFDHPNRYDSLNGLANALAFRFEQCQEAKDLDEAITHHRAALRICPKRHRSNSLNNLACCLRTRFDRNKNIADLNEAIDHHRTALRRRRKGHPSRPDSLNNLAVSLQARFDLQGRTADIDESIEHLRGALKLFYVGHPRHSGSLINLSTSLFSRFKKSGLMNDFEECIQLLGCAAEHVSSSLMMRLQAANQWAEFARSNNHHTTSKAYKVAMLLLQRTLTINPSLNAQHDFLSGKVGYMTLTLNAVAYAVEENRLEEAIEILEQGRGLLWSQMRGFRTPLSILEQLNRALADRFRDISRQLDDLATSSTRLPHESSSVESRSAVQDREREMFEEKLKLRKQLLHKQEEIINEIRQLPGFESFLATTPFKVLQQAASEGPVIVVNTSRYRSDALIVLSRKDLPVVCIPLDREVYKDSIELHWELLKTRFDFTANSPEYNEKLVKVMRILWDKVVSKVVDKLKELEIAEGSRIWWCPTFMLSALPFHAAGPFKDSDGSASYFLDKYTSSYTPTLEALVNARSDGNTGDVPRVLVIGDMTLPSAKQEIKNIQNCGISTQKLLGKKASHEAVIGAIQETKWVHFVCHGNLHDSKPFEFSFKLFDRGLTLLDIVQANVPNAEFAFLSACHTAEQLDVGAYDEVLHLAAAMQFSGFRSVIGSMWALLDLDGPFFAKTVYDCMCNGDDSGPRYKRAAAGLREAAVELKSRSEISTERWVNLIHIGA